MKQKLSWIALVLFLAMLIPNLALAQTENPRMKETMDRLIKEGWTPVGPGVAQRSHGDNKVETFAFGPDGLRHAVKELEGKLAFLQQQYRSHRKADLQKAINDLKSSIAKLKVDAKKAEKSTADVLAEKNGCTVSFGSNSDAYWLTNGAGTAATASGSFNNTCGYYADTHAFAHAYATRGTLTETLTQSDPKSGYNISSSAVVSVPGSTPCFSEAYSHARFTGGNIFLSFSDTNYSCPSPPVTVSISGPTYILISGYNSEIATWTATASSGVPGYSYQWYRDGYPVGTGSTYSESFFGSNWDSSELFELSVTVTDSASQTASATHSVNVWYSREYNNECGMYRFPYECPYIYPEY